jgi:hypothetical protein
MIADRRYRAATFLAARVQSRLRFASPTLHAPFEGPLYLREQTYRPDSAAPGACSAGKPASG